MAFTPANIKLRSAPPAPATTGLPPALARYVNDIQNWCRDAERAIRSLGTAVGSGTTGTDVDPADVDTPFSFTTIDNLPLVFANNTVAHGIGPATPALFSAHIRCIANDTGTNGNGSLAGQSFPIDLGWPANMFQLDGTNVYYMLNGSINIYNHNINGWVGITNLTNYVIKLWLLPG